MPRALLPLLLSLFLSIPGLAFGQQPTQVEDPFRVEIAGVEVPAGGSANIGVLMVVPAEHHLYRDMIEVRMDEPGAFSLGEPDMPMGDLEPDPAFPEKKREAYHQTFTIQVPVNAPADAALGATEVELQVRYQGCKDKICYLPREQSIPVTLTVTAGAAHAPVATDLAGFGERPSLTEDKPVGVVALPGDGEVRVAFFQLEGWHINRNMTFIELGEGAPVQAGEQHFPPAHAFTDPTTGMERQEIGGDFIATLDLSGSDGTHTVPITVGFQACKDNLCLMPQYPEFTIELTLGGAAAASDSDGSGSGAPAATGVVGDDAFSKAREKGLLWLVLFVFGAGFLVSLTPCVLPMIPITIGIIGARASGSRLKAFSLSLTYVAGLALVYTALGASAGLMGSMFGGWMQSPWVVGGVAVFFAAMGLAMFGLFDVAMPSGITTKLNQMGGSGYGGAFVVGMVGAIVAGPCSGPVIATLMVMVGAGGEIMLGVFLMLAFSLGMGMLFLAAGLFSSVLLRPGAWMESVKRIFGVIMLLGAIYFAKAHMADWVTAVLTSGVLLATAVFGWPSDDSEGPKITKAHKLYSVVAGIVGAWLLVALMATYGFILPPLQLSSGGAGAAAQGPHIEWQSDEAAAFAQAKAENKPVVIDFTAEWCAACQELEHITYQDPRVIERSESFVPVMLDSTDAKDATVKALQEKYEVLGLPTVVFVLPDGTTMDDLKVTGFVDADDFLGRMDEALERL
jgi:thioredoxin:protein disulfide reductase